jgi:hypothetical protein
MGRLDIRVVEARNLPDTEMVGKPDPYVIVKLEHQTHKTKVVNDSLNPKWDEVIKFLVSDQNSAQLRFEVWNSNVVSDEFLGCYTLSITGLYRGVVKDEWFLLQQCKANAEIRIRLLAQDFGMDPLPGMVSNAHTMNQDSALPPAKPAAPVPMYTGAAPPPAQQVGQAHVPAYGTQGAAPAPGPASAPPPQYVAPPPPQPQPAQVPPPPQAAYNSGPAATPQYSQTQAPPAQQYNSAPVQQPGGYGAAPGQPPAGYGAPPQQPPAGYGAPHQQPPAGYGAPPQQAGGYASAPQQPMYGAPQGGPVYPPAQGQYPPPQAQQPVYPAQYPPAQGQYPPPPQGQYPPAPQGYYPPPTGQYPPAGAYPPQPTYPPQGGYPAYPGPQYASGIPPQQGYC